MAAGPWLLTDAGRTRLLDGSLAPGPDTFKCALFLSTSNIGAASDTYAALTNEHANANGYTTGGIAVDIQLSGTTTVKMDFATDPVWTAAGGNIVARWAVVYEVGGSVLCYALLESPAADVTVTPPNTLTVAAHATNGIGSLA